MSGHTSDIAHGPLPALRIAGAVIEQAFVDMGSQAAPAKKPVHPDWHDALLFLYGRDRLAEGWLGVLGIDLDYYRRHTLARLEADARAVNAHKGAEHRHALRALRRIRDLHRGRISQMHWGPQR